MPHHTQSVKATNELEVNLAKVEKSLMELAQSDYGSQHYAEISLMLNLLTAFKRFAKTHK